MTTETRRDYWLDKPEEFYTAGLFGFDRVDGAPVLLPGFGEFDAFVYRDPFGWGVVCSVTGCLLTPVPPREKGRHWDKPSDYSPTREEAIEKAVQRLKEVGEGWEALRQATDRCIKRSGLSPRYRWEDEVQE